MALRDFRLTDLKWQRPAAIIAAALILPATLGAIALTLELQDRLVSQRIGQYLLRHNNQRSKSGAIWDAIRGSDSGRLGLLTADPESIRSWSRESGTTSSGSIESGDIPGVLLKWDFRVEVRPTSLVLESSPRDTAIAPGNARRGDIQALAASLRAYRLGQDLLHRAALETRQHETRTSQFLDSLLVTDELIPVIDGQLHARRAPPRFLLGQMSVAQQDHWRQYLQQWRDGRHTAIRSGIEKLFDSSPPDPDSEQGRFYKRICRALLEEWSDSLYTSDFLRLTDGWSKGGGYSALVSREEADWRGRAVLGNGDVLEFVIPSAIMPSTILPDSVGYDSERSAAR